MLMDELLIIPANESPTGDTINTKYPSTASLKTIEDRLKMEKFGLSKKTFSNAKEEDGNYLKLTREYNYTEKGPLQKITITYERMVRPLFKDGKVNKEDFSPDEITCTENGAYMLEEVFLKKMGGSEYGTEYVTVTVNDLDIKFMGKKGDFTLFVQDGNRFMQEIGLFKALEDADLDIEIQNKKVMIPSLNASDTEYAIETILKHYNDKNIL